MKLTPIIGDRWCHSRDIQGFRGIMPWKRALSSHILYVQAYMTEKDVQYSKRSSTSGIAFIADDAYRLNNRFNHNLSILELGWKLAANRNFAARIEYRLSLDASIYMLKLQNGTKTYFSSNQMLYYIPSQVISEWKTMHLSTYGNLISSIYREELLKPLRQNTNRRRFVIWLTYLINSLISRPPDHSTFKEFAKAVEVHKYILESNRPYIKCINWDSLQFMLPETCMKVDSLINNPLKTFKAAKRQQLKDTLPENPRPAPILDGTKDEIAKKLFNCFIRDVWGIFPSPKTNLYPDIDVTPEFTVQFIQKAVKNPHFVKWTKATSNWYARFKRFFNEDRPLEGKNLQGWTSLPYLYHHRFYMKDLDNNEKGQFSNMLWEMFCKLQVLPAGDNYGKVWKTRRLKRNDAHVAVYFIVNKDY